jgi:glycosyltransferase involved in cell wall biosynthesis
MFLWSQKNNSLAEVILKKVLYISPNGYLGGAERFVLTAVKTHTSGQKISASILFFSAGEAYEEAKTAGLECYLLSQSFRFRYPWKLILALLEIRSVVKKVKPDILQLTMPYSHISLSLATIGIKLKKVWFQHGPVGSNLDRLANLFPVDVILYNSHDVEMRHRLTWPHASIKIKELIINYGIDVTPNIHTIFENPTLTLGTAGRICSWKGFHNILIAIGELKREKSLRPFKLKIAGSAKMELDKLYKNKLLELTKSYDLSTEVEFLEHQKDMEQFYQELDIFLHASVIPEPFGLVVAESMMNGCLVIASNDGGVKDLIQNGISGFNYSATTDNAVPELKEVLLNFLDSSRSVDKNKYQKIAKVGKNYIQKNYSIEQMKDQLENLYLEIC